MKSLKLIQVGVGGWGWSWLDIARQSPGWDVVALVDIDKQVLDQAVETYGVSPSCCFLKLDEALRTVEADAALVVVPPQTHADVSIAAMEAGLDVLVEKAMADTMEAAKRMVQKAEALGRKLMVSQNYRFKRAPRTVRTLVQSGLVGEVGYLGVNFHKAPKFTTVYRLQMAYPLVRDMSIHHFDQMRSILGLEPVSVDARTWKPKWSWFEGDPTFTAIFKFENDVWVNYFGSWVSRGWETTWDGDWRIAGTDGEIHWADNRVWFNPSEVYKSVFILGLFERQGRLEADLVPMPCEDRWYSLYEFHQAIVENRPPETNASDNLRSLAMVFAIIDSAEQRREVLIAEYL